MWRWGVVLMSILSVWANLIPTPEPTPPGGTIPSAPAPAVTSIGHVDRLLVIGNSITLHSPNPAIGWIGFWGMAATQPDRDFAHRLQLGITARQADAPDLKIISADLSNWPANLAEQITLYRPDVLVVQMGNNTPKDWPAVTWINRYTELANAAPTIPKYAIGLWGIVPGDEREGYLQQAAQHAHMLYIPVADLFTASNRADSCINDGVCWHPGDRGMREIAERILRAMYGEIMYVPLVLGEK